MGIIRPLDEHLANQIAAGEVVERPASVLKELVENAVDAGGRHIEITAEEGGLTFLRIKDDGAGIQPDDLLTAFRRHATSKISSAKDLFQIETLGFRGEALPSIAAVAKVRCVSANADDGLARYVEIEGGAVKSEGETNAPRGTEMTVRDLFFNTPARLKYMKTIQTELGHLSDVVYRQALARPDIAFTFRHNETVLLRTPGNGDLRQVVAAIYGTAAAKAMVQLRSDDPDYSLTGLTALPVETRANRNAVTILVNGRYVRSQAVVQPLLQAYHTLLPLHRYPLSVLNLRMHPALVDVNVHPAKLEVRFSKEAELRAFIEETVKEALAGQAYIPSGTSVRKPKQAPAWMQDQIRFQLPPEEAEAQAPAEAVAVAEVPSRGVFAGMPSAETRTPYAAGSGQSAAAPSAATRPASASPAVSPAVSPAASQQRKPPPASGGNGSLPAEQAAAASEPIPESVWQAAFAAPPEKPAEPAFPELSWIGQLHGTYIVAQNENGLFLIDQHAAHERINYEYYYDKFGRPEEASQELLFPVTMEFAPDEFALLRERLPVFAGAGVYLEEFGGNTFIIRAVPHWFPEGDEADVAREIADWVLQERKIDLHALREKAAILCSCKASIKANQALTRESGDRLLQRLGQCRQPYTCPHGRPIVVSFSKYELEKMFKRVMS
ncbi:DNA mismatch repair endonuclease MutL [Cohnella sp. CFH 77786]|uniref:DNA mismatch repair endonuclease MutL n=1 Tax=Cohnella sp. CFH 77786 TaxID=2662265 RepID=UPI001C60F6EC|nr:DNA mismatch repair endonuclease MutL [Cohnella sp. CFH 77786]MBW5448198.1 DNA mismatch repair endonuclease MutL [Cohnella sp. CFH 77786]